MQKKDGEGTSALFVAGCNMKTNGIVAAQHPKSTRKRRQIKNQQQGHLAHFWRSYAPADTI